MSKGTSLIQIMVVISVLSAIAIVSIPNVLRSRLAANETAAINSLKYIAQAQDYFREEMEHNLDNDDSGEYGTFALLCGAENTSRGRKASPPYLNQKYFISNPDDHVELSGYRFRVFLPIQKRKTGKHEFTIIDEREEFWCAYGWPIKPRETGDRVYFINQFGLIYSIDAKNISMPIQAKTAYTTVPFSSEINITEWRLER